MTPAERIALLERAYGELSDQDKAVLSYPVFHHHNWNTKLTFRGLTPSLDYKRIEYALSVSNDTQDVATILGELRVLARDQRKLHEVRKLGYLIDLPILAMLKSLDLTPSHLIERIRDLRSFPMSPGQTSINFNGQSMTPNIVDGRITGSLTLSGAKEAFVAWENGGVRAYDYKTPLILKTSLVGKAMREVIDHPWLEGLTIRKASGNTILTLKANEKAVPAGAFDVLGMA